MAQTEDNKLVVGYKETKEVLSFVITLVTAIKKARTDDKISIADIQYFIPVLFLVGPAIEGVDNVKVEMMMATPGEADDLKKWLAEQIPTLTDDEKIINFIKDAFAVVLDIWMVLKTYILVATPAPAVSEITGEPLPTK